MKLISEMITVAGTIIRKKTPGSAFLKKDL